MSGFVKAGQTFLKALMSGGKQKTTGTEVIKNIPIAKNIDTKRAIQDKVTKTVDKAFKDADPQGVYTQTLANKKKKSELKRDEGKKLKNISYRLDKLQEKVEKKAKGGRVGLKRGTGLMNKKSNIKKIKETFGPKKGLGMQSVIYGLDKNPNITKADPKAKFIAAANKKKKKVIG
jgi:hypothetical protein